MKVIALNLIFSFALNATPSISIADSDGLKFCSTILSNSHLSESEKIVALQDIANEYKRKVRPKTLWEKNTQGVFSEVKDKWEPLPLFILNDPTGRPEKVVFFIGRDREEKIVTNSNAVEYALVNQAYSKEDNSIMKSFVPNPLISKLKGVEWKVGALGLGGGILAAFINHNLSDLQIAGFITWALGFTVITARDGILKREFDNHLQTNFKSRYLENNQPQVIALLTEPEIEPRIFRWLKGQGFTDLTPGNSVR
jgi:hypothetical protein